MGAEARGEIADAASYFEWVAEEGRRVSTRRGDKEQALRQRRLQR